MALLSTPNAFMLHLGFTLLLLECDWLAFWTGCLPQVCFVWCVFSMGNRVSELTAGGLGPSALGLGQFIRFSSEGRILGVAPGE